MVEASPIWGVVGIIVLMVLCFLSVPIAASLGITGLVLALLFYGDLRGILLAGLTAWAQASSYTLSMIPLFVMMGAIFSQCEVGRDAYVCFYKWLSGVKGGLAIVTAFTSAAFGSITGSTAAAIVTVGGIAAPEMKAKGYSNPLRLGTIAVSGCLATLIPPSNFAIFYCVLTGTSIAQVFMAGMIPGVILMIAYSVIIYVWVLLRPSAAPSSRETISFKQRFASLHKIVPILIVFLAIIGGIFTGIFTPTEAAGVGAFFAIALTLVMRRLSWQRFKVAMIETMRITAFIMVLVMGALLFSNTMAISQLPAYINDTIIALDLNPSVNIFAIMIVFLVFGCFLDVYGLMVLFVPLFYPTVISLGFSPVWFGALTVVLIEMAVLTPPVGGNLYITQSLDVEATAADVIRGTFPFYVAILALLVLILLFPQIVLWLPGIMMF